MIGERIAAVQERIARAAARAGRNASDITLVAVGKNHPASALRGAYEAGLRDFGENRMQEADQKARDLADLGGLRWHIIGHVQSNKARKAVALAHLFHSLDSLDMARRLNRIAGEMGKVLPVLLQVDLAGEATKFGMGEDDLMRTLESVRGSPHLTPRGLMILPPFDEDPERTRPFFSRLRELRDHALQAGLLDAGELSMGMSHDLEAAIVEGATLVRVGTALFGERSAG